MAKWNKQHALMDMQLVFPNTRVFYLPSRDRKCAWDGEEGINRKTPADTRYFTILKCHIKTLCLLHMSVEFPVLLISPTQIMGFICYWHFGENS
jgi:hypothetical protein